MCEALEELMKDELDARERKGEMTGQMKGIQSLIETCIEFGVSYEDIVSRLMQKFSLTRKSAEEYMHLYW